MTSVRSAVHLVLLLVVPWAESSPAAPGAGELARCAEIAAPDARLSCYDALAGRMAASVRTPAGAPPAPRQRDAADFGLNPVQPQPAPVAARSIEARVTKVIAVRPGLGHPSVLLDNGQVWTFTETEDDARLGPGDPVSIKRAALGSFLMTTPSKHTYHVRRAP